MNIGTFFRGVLCPFDSGSRFLLYPETSPLKSAIYRNALLHISSETKEYLFRLAVPSEVLRENGEVL